MYTGLLPYFGYIKKEDAKEILSRQRVMGWILAVALGIIFGILNVWVAPRILTMYQEFGYELPWYADSGMRTIVFLLAIVSLFLIRPESDEIVAKKLQAYKAGEMILMRNLTDWRYLYTAAGILIASMMYIIISIVLPIYDITSRV